MTAPLDLGKPMRWKGGKTVAVIHHGKAGAALKTEGAQWPHWYTPTELDELFENIPPEPPKVVGPRPFGYAYRYPDGYIRYSSGRRINGSDPIEAIPLYTADQLRADLARKVKPLTDDECYKLSLAVQSLNTGHPVTNAAIREHFAKLMAARGGEVGE